jgi:hypothetical protein
LYLVKKRDRVAYSDNLNVLGVNDMRQIGIAVGRCRWRSEIEVGDLMQSLRYG